MNFIKQFISLLRIPQWSKAIFVFLGVIYSASFSQLIPAFLAAVAFCFLSSAVYIYNDIHDRGQDRLHPYKCLRPIASGAISWQVASITLIFLIILGFSLGWLGSNKLMIILATYLLVNLIYNHGLKSIRFLDALCIASGFMLRILAGTIGIGIHLSYWLTIAAVLLSLFIAFSKRRLEKLLYLTAEIRPVLKKYKLSQLDFLISFTAISSFMAYFLYIFSIHIDSFCFLLTLPLVALGMYRFIWLIKNNNQQDDPLLLISSDKLSLINLLCFFILTIVALVPNSP